MKRSLPVPNMSSSSTGSTYEKTVGANNNKGAKYEFGLLALLYLRMLRSGYSFMLASNMQGLGALDDIFIRVEQDAAYCIQLKHKKQAKEIPTQALVGEGSFGMLKYYKAYCDIEDEASSSNNDTISQISFNNFHFILYTNCPIRHKSSNTATCELTETERFLFTRGEVFSFGSRDSEVWDLKIGSRDAQRYRKFLTRLLIFNNQANVSEVIELVLQEVAAMSQVTKEEATVTTSNFLQKIEAWWCEDNYYLTQKSSLWYDIILEQLNDTEVKVLSDKLIKFHPEKIHLIPDDTQYLNVSVPGINVDSRCSRLLIEMKQKFGQNFLLVRNSAAVKKYELINDVCSRGFCKALAINVDKKSLIKQTLNLLKPVQSIMILVSDANLELTDFHLMEDVWKFNDLQQESQAAIMEREIDFQGYEVPISDLGNSNVMSKVLNGKELATLMNGERFQIGVPLSNSDELYIERTLYHQTVLKKEILHAWFLDDAIAVSNFPYIYHGELSPNVEILSLAHQSLQYLDHRRFQKICEERKYLHNVHWLVFEGDFLLWRESHGRYDTVSAYVELQSNTCQTNSPGCYHRKNFPDDWKDRLRIITGPPGMGKSTVLRHIARNYKEKNPNMWVLLVPLRNCTTFLDNMTPETVKLTQVVDMLVQVGVEGALGSCLLIKTLFLHCLKSTGKVCLFLDAVDEVAPKYKAIVLHIIQLFLQETQVQHIWITSRTILETFLQNSLSCLPLMLQPFNSEQQMSFLREYLSRQGVNNVTRVLDVIQQYKASEEPIFEVPLHAQLAADTFLNMYKWNPNVTITSLNLHEMYENFFIMKHNIFYRKYNLDITNAAVDDDREEKFKMFMENHTKCALLVTFSLEQLSQLNISSIGEQVEDFLANIEKQRIGIIDKVLFGKPQFVHVSYAEYLVALWFRQCYEKTSTKNGKDRLSKLNKLMKQALKPFNMFRVLFDWELGNIRLFFDHMMAGTCKLHQAVLRNDLKVVKKLLEDGSSAEEVDNGGRLAIHLAASYSRVEMVKLLADYTNGSDTMDRILQWCPIQFADRVKAWEIVIFLLQYDCKGTELIGLKREIHDKLIRKAILVAARSRSEDVIRIFQNLGFALSNYNTSHALHLASAVGDCRLVKKLLKRDSHVINNSLPHLGENTPLHQAAKCGHTEVASILLNNKANLHAYNMLGFDPLHVAAKNGHSNIVRMLIERGASPKSRRRFHENFLHFATREGQADILEWLIDRGTPVGITNWHGKTPLHIAAHEGRCDIAQLLITKGAWIDAKDDLLWTPLHFAVLREHSNITQLLLERGASIEARDEHQNTPLHIAAREGRSEIVQLLLARGASVESKDDVLRTPLHFAALRGHSDTAQLLIAKGASVTAKDASLRTPLHFAVFRGHSHTAQILIEKGISIDTKDRNEETPLHIAAQEGRSEMAKWLIERGASVKSQDFILWTPLHFASTTGHYDTVLLLIEKGAPLEAKDIALWTPLHLAASEGHATVVQLLLETGALVDAVDNEQFTPLHVAAKEGHTEIVQLLLRKSAEVDSADNELFTPLHLASREGHSDIVQLLLEKGALVEATNNELFTPLHLAAREGHTNIVQILLEKGASVEAADKKQFTPLQLAARKGHTNIVQILLNAADERRFTPLHLEQGKNILT